MNWLSLKRKGIVYSTFPFSLKFQQTRDTRVSHVQHKIKKLFTSCFFNVFFNICSKSSSYGYYFVPFYDYASIFWLFYIIKDGQYNGQQKVTEKQERKWKNNKINEKRKELI